MDWVELRWHPCSWAIGRVRSKGKEGKVNRDVMPLSAVEKCFKIAQESLVYAPGIAFNKLPVRHPDAGANKADAVGGHLREVLVPDPRVPWGREIPVIVFAGKVVGPHREEG